MSRHGTRIRRTARIIEGERRVAAAAYKAIRALGDAAVEQLISSGMNPAVLDDRNPVWRNMIEEVLLPAVGDVYTAGWAAEIRQVTAAAEPSGLPEAFVGDRSLADTYASTYLTSAGNRMNGISNTVFQQMTAAIEEGRQREFPAYTSEDGREVPARVGESIPQITARVNALLDDDQRWKNRATVIARTETIAANNAGSHAAAAYNAQVLGTTDQAVVKEWLATSGSRTRETHAEADGQQVLGISTPFTVGGALMQYPGDPTGPPGEVVQCRCTSIYVYPGDPEYPTSLTAAAIQEDPMTHRPGLTAATDPEETQTGVVLVALPAADDPVRSIGEEDKHATLLYFGDVAGSGAENENPGLTDDFRTLLSQIAATVAGQYDPVTETVTGVESLGDEGARVWMLAGDALPGIRTDLLDVDTEAQTVLDGVEQYPSYTPHVTIGYPVPVSADGPEVPVADGGEANTLPLDVEEAAAGVAEIRFDRIGLWWGGEQTEWPLAAAAPADAPSAPPAGETTASVLDAFARFAADLRHAGISVDDLQASLDSTYVDEQPVQTPPADGPQAADIPTDGQPFYGILWPENVQSGDGRGIEAGATTWRDLPLSLMVQDAQAPGHDGAVRSGRINTIERDEATYAVPVIRYAGVWDTSDVALEAARQVEAGVSRGISVDGDAVTVEIRGSDGRTLDPMVDDFPEDGVVIEVATAARVAGATVCSIPAFHQAYIANGTLEARTDPEPGWNDDGTPKDNTLDAPAATGDVPAEDPEAVVASAWSLVASPVTAVPAAAFQRPEVLDAPEYAEKGCPLTVTEDGRVYGHLATWGTCHIGIDGLCQEPPASATNYAYFATGSVLTDEGTYMPVGPLVMETGHAALSLGARPAASHYDNTGTAVADVTMGQDHLGIWFAGVIRPGTSPEQVYALRASGKVSGDWRDCGGNLELIAALVVNTPGFPIPRPSLAASAGRAQAMVAAGIVRTERPPEAPSSVSELTAAVMAALDRRDRAYAARDRINKQRATIRGRKAAAAAARINGRA